MVRKRINKIIIHCSDSPFGTAGLIDEWHKERGWSGIGYQLVILNGFPTAENWKSQDRISFLDGAIETGRMNDFDKWIDGNEQGAHALGYNRNSIGICFILEKGKVNLTPRQLEKGVYVVKYLMLRYDIKLDAVLGHCEVDDNPNSGARKSCPDFDMDSFRNIIRCEYRLEGIDV